MRAAVILLISLFSGSALSQDGPRRILPFLWGFDIVALKGPGCTDLDSTSELKTRPTYGENTMDGSEIYYWYFAYPGIQATVGGDVTEASTWCETTLAYTEYADSRKTPAVGYRLQLHKNGTRMLAVYDLEEGVEVNWKFTYLANGAKIVDELPVRGPYQTGKYGSNLPSLPTEPVQWKLPHCGNGTITYRTELHLKSKGGAKGTVISELVEYEGESRPYGVQQGVSYDWSRCET